VEAEAVEGRAGGAGIEGMGAVVPEAAE
jgi:hypothetical protein